MSKKKRKDEVACFALEILVNDKLWNEVQTNADDFKNIVENLDGFIGMNIDENFRNFLIFKEPEQRGQAYKTLTEKGYQVAIVLEVCYVEKYYINAWKEHNAKLN